MHDLMNEVESMNTLLSEIGTNIISHGSGRSETPITAYLREVKLISDDELLPRHIPDTILIQHFVELRIVLRGSALYSLK